MAIINTSTGGLLLVNNMPNVENVDPRSFLKTMHMKSRIPVYVRVLDQYFGGLTKLFFQKIKEIAAYDAEELIIKEETMTLPSQIYSILEKDLKKKDQIKLLRGLTITKEQLGGIFLQAGKRGYKLSNYFYEIKPKSLKDIPSYVFIHNNGMVEKSNNTKMSDIQLKNYLNTIYFVVLRILDNGKHWHCFFQTKRGLQGKESGEEYGSKPHIHYYSDSFGVSKDYFIERTKNGKIPTSPVHILLTD